MPLFFIFVIGIAVALTRRRLLAAAGDPVLSQDAPARLLGWAVGLLRGAGAVGPGDDRRVGPSGRPGATVAFRPRLCRCRRGHAALGTSRRRPRGPDRGRGRRRRAGPLHSRPLPASYRRLDLDGGGGPAAGPDRLHPWRQRTAAPPRGGRSRAGRRPARRGDLADGRRVHLQSMAQLTLVAWVVADPDAHRGRGGRHCGAAAPPSVDAPRGWLP